MMNMFYDKVKVQSKTLGFFNQLSGKNKWGMDAECPNIYIYIYIYIIVCLACVLQLFRIDNIHTIHLLHYYRVYSMTDPYVPMCHVYDLLLYLLVYLFMYLSICL